MWTSIENVGRSPMYKLYLNLILCVAMGDPRDCYVRPSLI